MFERAQGINENQSWHLKCVFLLLHCIPDLPRMMMVPLPPSVKVGIMYISPNVYYMVNLNVCFVFSIRDICIYIYKEWIL